MIRNLMVECFETRFAAVQPSALRHGGRKPGEQWTINYEKTDHHVYSRSARSDITAPNS
jgi:hypothetical protein